MMSGRNRCCRAFHPGLKLAGNRIDVVHRLRYCQAPAHIPPLSFTLQIGRFIEPARRPYRARRALSGIYR
jgi:hypothetical protein